MLEKLFGFDRNVTRVRTEVLAGITTFLTMAYILAVNPNILSATGMDKGALFTTTVVASAFATLLMAFYAKLPFGLAPGMGLNAFFAYTVCLTNCRCYTSHTEERHRCRYRSVYLLYRIAECRNYRKQRCYTYQHGRYHFRSSLARYDRTCDNFFSFN